MENPNDPPLILELGQQPPPTDDKIGMLVHKNPYKQFRLATDVLPTLDDAGEAVKLTDILAVTAAMITKNLRAALRAARDEGITVEDISISAVLHESKEGEPTQPLKFGFIVNGLGLRVPREGDTPDIVDAPSGTEPPKPLIEKLMS